MGGPAVRRVLAGVVSLSVVAMGCSQSDDPERVLVPTTSAEGAVLGPIDPELAEEAPGDLLVRLDAAEAERDMCALAGVLEAGLPRFDDPEAVIEVYRRLAEVVVDATEWVPDELADDWEPISAVITDGAAAVEAAEGDLTRPGVAATFDGDDLQRSVITVARWARRNC